MDKKDTSSPLPGSGLFDPAALLGASPFSSGLAAALPFAHLGHLPASFSMMGHPTFPVTSLFGHLTDGLMSPLGMPTSIPSSLSSTSGFSLFSLPSPVASSSVAKLSFSPSSSTLCTFSSSATSPPSKSQPCSQMSPLEDGFKSRERKASHRSNGQGLGCLGGPNGRTLGLHSPPGFGSQTNLGNSHPLRSRSGSSRSRGSGRGRRSGGRGRGRRKPALPLSLVQSTSLLSPSMLEKFARKHLEESSSGGSAEQDPADGSGVSNLFDVNFESASQSRFTKSTKSSTIRKSPPQISINDDLTTMSQGHVHIDSFKRKLIADQIRQKMENKSGLPLFGLGTESFVSLSKKRRGRQPRISSDDDCELTPEELEEEARIQARLKRELELEVKQKEIALKLITKSVEQSRGRGKGYATKSHNQLNGKPTEDLNGANVGETAFEEDKGHQGKIKDLVLDTDNGAASNIDSNEHDVSGSGSGDDYTEDSGEDTGEESALRTKRKCLAKHENGRPIKRRHVVLDDFEIRVPLEKGWKRQTNIHSYGRRGIVGEVWYFAPCGRKMKTIPDVMRYIERNGITDLGRGHFSFNTKVNVGEFYEARVRGGENGFVKLTDSEIQDRLSVTVSRRLKKIENQKRQEKLRLHQSMARQMIESRMKQKMEQQDMARKVAEMQFQKRMQRDQQKDLLKRAKQLKLLEKRKKREHERQQREDQEREMKRQQVTLLKEQMRMRQEQDRRRQHMILLKALEQRKKQEEREKQREERMTERRLTRERKEEQRKMEFVLAQELKKPREDMELRDSKLLPDIPRIPGNHLDGEAFADCLMSLEFMHNFAKPLGFDDESLPTLCSLQDAVCCKTEEDGEEYLSLVTHLLRYALDDPGVPNPKEAVTKLGQKITDIEVTDVILGEVLRVFMVVRNGGDTELSECLRNYPLEACSIRQRAAVVAFLINELNCSKMITIEIENHLDGMADLRRDKWLIEGKIRRLRVLRNKKFKIGLAGRLEVGEDSVTVMSKHSDDDDDKDDSTHEDETFNEQETDEDEPGSLEELEKQMDKLQKQHGQLREKVFEKSQHVRGIDLGQDRYKRNYWILPHVGGIYLEGMESGKIKDVVLPKTCSERSESRTKIEVIGEKTEKKGISFFGGMLEKVVGDIKDIQVEDGSKVVADNKLKLRKDVKVEVESCSEFNMLKDERPMNGLVRLKPDMENVELSDCNKQNEKIVSNGGFVEHEIECEIKHEGNINAAAIDIPIDIDIVKNDTLHEVENKMKCEQETPQNNFVSGNRDLENLPITKHVELKIPSIRSSAIEEQQSETTTDSKLFLNVPQTFSICNSSGTDSMSNISSLPLCSLSSSLSSSLFMTSDTTVTSSLNLTSALFLNTSFTDQMTKSIDQINSSLLSPLNPPPAHSQEIVPERKASFMSIESILGKSEPSSQSDTNLLISQSSVLPVNPFSTQISLEKTSSETHVIDSRPWFTLLPRVPCDDMSLTQGQHSSGMLISPPFMSQLPFHPFSMTPSFSSYQMDHLFTSVSSVTATTSVTPSSVMQSKEKMSFKKPEPVSSSQNPEDVLKSYQGEAKPIPEELQRGWWKVVDREQVQELQRCLHPRGTRERDLHKQIQKYEDYALACCTVGKHDVLCMESSSEEEITDDEDETANIKTTENHDSLKNGNDLEQKSTANDSDTSDKNSENSIGCRRHPKNGCDENLDNDFNLAVRNNSKIVDNSVDEKEQKQNKENEETSINELDKKKYKATGKNKKGKGKKQNPIKKMKKVKKAAPTIDCKSKSDEADRLVLEEVETLEDRIASASLQIKGWKLAPKTYSDESDIRIIPRIKVKQDENDCYPIEAAKERLLQLELNIERRYLKPPLSKARHRLSLTSMSCVSQPAEVFDDADSEVDFENLPIGLQLWRIAAATATSPAQLMLCVVQLNNCIAWEKSIMKVLCQICRRDDNEAELLLCDGCDRGYHTYCFKPRLECIPEGDWYCFECVAKAVGECCCLVCGRRLGKMAECIHCNRHVHIDCLHPPLPRVPRKWHCAACSDNVKGAGKKRVRKNSCASITTTSQQPTPGPTPELTPSGRKRRCDFGVPRKRKSSENSNSTTDFDIPRKLSDEPDQSCDQLLTDTEAKSVSKDHLSDQERFKLQEQSNDMRVCRTMLTEMMKHEDGWPFLQPVNCKHFPSYRKYIKSPMDFGTMKIKLRDLMYTERSEFVNDARLVFDNCQLFNEDDSEVGQCGHNMRKFFNQRWKEILFEAMTEHV
ncbi:bromodomain adjacent to zinc finger domain protein 2B-like isoform X3 [Mya arenaria]|uniref:bromodomain adjacent to zinc finger domain protein 2B-like isoform X3 n=1 Tax=Mya arenaria TaxID=6604 RepID=UPI0022E756F7|nr:bromodomain adjacent to zinc finger domain protein 2B-like isoform X3 [Mya arenaria]